MRWTPSRKAEVLRMIRVGEIGVEAACEIWGLSIEELLAWVVAERRAGRAGLKATALPPGRLRESS
ncbi:MAG: DUF1153 domain-containing protein [Phenylobacterium sp.]